MIIKLSLDKALGLDGFPIRFYQTFWSVVGNQVSDMISSFLIRGHLPHNLNQTFICLLPERELQQTYSDFRLINFCNVAFKFITRLVVTRLHNIMESLISPFQNAIVKGRQISNNIILAIQQFHYMRKCKSKNDFWIAMKIDFRKASDCLSWNFIE